MGGGELKKQVATSQIFLVTPVNPRRPQKEGETLPLLLETEVTDEVGRRLAGPHACGRAEILSDGRVAITPSRSAAGRTAQALLADDIIDAVLWNGSLRLRVFDEPLTDDPGDA